MFSFGEDSSEVYNRPALSFPDAFEIGISTNDPGLNVTELIYFVSIPLLKSKLLVSRQAENIIHLTQ